MNVRFQIKGLLLLAAATLISSACACNGVGGDDPKEGNLSFEPASLSLGHEAWEGEVTVTADCDWGVSSADRDWCSVFPSGGISGTTRLKVSVAENPGDSERQTVLTFRYGGATRELTVTQELNPAAVKPPVDPTVKVPEGYALDWNDEFDLPDDSSPDMDKWRFESKPAGWVNHEKQTYVPGARNGVRTAFIKGGALNIRAVKDGADVLSARMYSKKSWTYGYMEASIKLPKGKGTWPAFWMMPDDFSRGWPACGEIDIMEEVGYHPNYTSSSIHCKNYYHSIGTQKTHERYTAGAEDSFHTYALEWTEDAMKFYVDGNHHFTFSNDKKNNDDTWPFNKNFYIILNLAWGGDWGGSQGVDESALPCTMEIDYVRVFKKK